MSDSSVRRSSSTGQVLGFASGIAVAIALYMMFVYAPTDSVQGHAQRIFYIHVPMAWLAYLAFFVTLVGSIGFLWKRSWKMDQIARASAEVGLVFTTLVLITGALWGKPIWGTYWTWDARLTTTLLLWFIYLAYFMVRSFIADPERGARFAAVLGIIGFIDVPIIHMSVRWWRTQHPEPIVTQSGGPAMPDSMLYTLIVSMAGFTILYAWLVYQKYQIEKAKDQLAEFEIEAEDARIEAEIREGVTA